MSDTRRARRMKQAMEENSSPKDNKSKNNGKVPKSPIKKQQKQKGQIKIGTPNSKAKPLLRKQISINPQNFVMCKVTDFQADYEIVGKLGEGSFGTVFRVRHRTMKLDRALKKIKKNSISNFSNSEQIQILKKLDHINILKIYQFYESNEYYMIVTDIFQGRELFDEIIDDRLDKINEEISARIIREVLVTLNYTHSLGIAHRDIKPQNILVRNIGDKDKFKMKIIDWGLGTLLLDQFTDRVCGTPQYAAPEVFQGKYSVLCDMWSLGVLAFIMLTGNMPFKGTNTEQTISQVKKNVINYRKTGFNSLSANAKDFVTSLIQKDQNKRMTAAKALQHPWIVEHRQAKSQPVFLKETLERLKGLNINNHFGVAVVNLINNHFSTNEQREKLEEIFQFLDTNGDGVLSKQQLVEGYSRIYGKELAIKIATETFAKLDVNNSGTLQYSEFVAYGIRREKQNEKIKLKEAFDVFDADKNGSISWKQVSNILEGKLEGLYEEDMKQMLREMDKNKDQEITFEQFYKFMENLMEKVDVIRQSKKRESQIKSQSEKRKYEEPNVKLKKTQSVDQPIQNIDADKISQKSQKSKGKQSPKKNKSKRK